MNGYNALRVYILKLVARTNCAILNVYLCAKHDLIYGNHPYRSYFGLKSSLNTIIVRRVESISLPFVTEGLLFGIFGIVIMEKRSLSMITTCTRNVWFWENICALLYRFDFSFLISMICITRIYFYWKNGVLYFWQRGRFWAKEGLFSDWSLTRMEFFLFDIHTYDCY